MVCHLTDSKDKREEKKREEKKRVAKEKTIRQGIESKAGGEREEIEKK